jgi:predicted dehydrogenase
MANFTRREILEQSLLAAAAAAAPAVPAFASEASGPRVGPNEVLRIGCVGVRGRGFAHVSTFSNFKDCQVVALSDIDPNSIHESTKRVEDKSGKKPAYYPDFRKMLEDKTIDAVSIATTNHTHSLFAIWAMQAGKHVYVEKPVSHNVWEGRKAVEAARKYKKVCQTGTQCRSSKGLKEAMAFLQAGKLGKLKVARGLCYKRRTSIGKKADGPVPAGVDYNLWLGPAPERPFNPNRFHYNWHWHWDYGNGDLGNQGIHQMDIARWGLGKKELAKKVISVGGRLGYEDDGETPNTQIVWLDYGDSQLIFEVRGLETDDYLKAKVGVVFHCENGYMVNPTYTSATAFDPKGEKIQTFAGGKDDDHFRNFVDAVRENKPESLNADIEEGHLSSALCHLGNVSYRLGKAETLGSAAPFAGLEDAQETFRRTKEHLEKNSVGGEAKVVIGRALVVDPRTETFVGDDEANKLIKREYRAPFVVPDQV